MVLQCSNLLSVGQIAKDYGKSARWLNEKLHELNYDLEEFIQNPSLYYPDWAINYYATANKIDYPILEDGELREMTREEKIIKLNMLELLAEGEKFEDGKLIVVDKPADLYYPIWNNELKCWEEGADRTQLIKDRTQKILQYKKLKDEIEVLEMFDEFEAPEGIADLKNQLAKLKQEINDLLVVINKLK